MASMRNYPSSVVTGLVLMSQGTCYFPKCSEPLVRLDEGTPVNNFEIAHVRAAKPGGPRYDAAMTNEQRDAFPNLVLLCLVHHKVVDRVRPQDFPTSTLQQWKEENGDGLTALQGLRGVTEEGLQALVTGAFEDVKSEIVKAIGDLERVSAEAAGLLRPLVSELAAARLINRGPDPDIAAMLVKAARDLGHLQETAPMLATAASRLRSAGV
ncbi:MAG TPA: hypothetical protein VL551_27535 [Actinospica sp.]|jgi:hypothetical protein|nr:hypothetical protein [Actinospica sp.]